MHNDSERDARRDPRHESSPDGSGGRKRQWDKENQNAAGPAEGQPGAEELPAWLVEDGLVEVVDGQPRPSPKGEEALAALQNLPAAGAKVPHYKAQERKLLWRGKTVLMFEREAPAQMTVLKAFEERGWMRHIANPYGPEPEDVEHLRQTLKDLNRRLEGNVLHFAVDGAGGVTWSVKEC